MKTLYNSQLDAFDLYHIHAENESHDHDFLFGGPVLPALGQALAGSVGAAISNTLVYPLDLIITRLQTQRHLAKASQDSASREQYKSDSLVAAFRKILDNEGIPGLYVGCLSDTVKTICDSFLFFLAYTVLRKRRLRARSAATGHEAKALPALEELFVGFLAGSFSKGFTTPISNVVTRLQVSASGARRSVRDIVKEIYDSKGPIGFWSGYSASLILTMNPSLTFLFFQSFLRLLPRSQREKPPFLATFLFAASGKAMASSITYPFSLAKARAQASSKVKEDEGEMEKDIEKVGVSKNLARQDAARKAASKTIFGSILKIQAEDGTSALYEGLSAEVVKGFLNHGITMVLKERLNHGIIQFWFALLSITKTNAITKT